MERYSGILKDLAAPAQVLSETGLLKTDTQATHGTGIASSLGSLAWAWHGPGMGLAWAWHGHGMGMAWA